MSKPAPEEASPALLRQALAERRARKALGYAKLLMKANPDDATVKLIVQAHEMRISELRSEGHVKEAEEMYAAVLASRPAWKNLFNFSTHAAANKPEAAAASLPAADKLEAWIRNEMLDPRILKGLPQDNPFAIEAALINAAGEAIASGDDALAKDKLQSIGRRSPFVDWRLFLQAQMAYYADDAKTLEDNLSRIAPGSPLTKLASELRQLAAGQLPEKRREISASLGHDLALDIDKLDALYRDRKGRLFVNLTNEIRGRLCQEGRPVLAYEIIGSYIALRRQAYFGHTLEDDEDEVLNCLLKSMMSTGGWRWNLLSDMMVDGKDEVEALDADDLNQAIKASSSPLARSLLHLKLAGAKAEDSLWGGDDHFALMYRRLMGLSEAAAKPQKLSRDQEKEVEAALREWPGNAAAWEMLIAKGSSPAAAIRRYAATAPNDLKLQDRLIRRAFDAEQPECGELMIAELRQGPAAARESKRLVDALFIPRIKAAQADPKAQKRIAAEIGPESPVEARRLALLLQWKRETVRAEKVRLGKLLADERAPLSLRYALESVLGEKLTTPPSALKTQLEDSQLVLENLLQILSDDPASEVYVEQQRFIMRLARPLLVDYAPRLELARRAVAARHRHRWLPHLAEYLSHNCYYSAVATIQKEALILQLELALEDFDARERRVRIAPHQLHNLKTGIFLRLRAAEKFEIESPDPDYKQRLLGLYQRHGLDRSKLVSFLKPIFCHWNADLHHLKSCCEIRHLATPEFNSDDLSQFRIPGHNS